MPNIVSSDFHWPGSTGLLEGPSNAFWGFAMHPKWLPVLAGVACLLIFILLPRLATEPTPLVKDGAWRLIFADEFDVVSLNQEKWTTCYWWNKDGCTNLGNEELQWYRPENVSLDGGLLRLQARPEKVIGFEGRAFEYTSGMVTTGRDYEELPRSSRVRFRYGHVEVRAKIPAGKGLWSAIWLLPETRESRPEIDVMEALGDSPTTLRVHYHYRDQAGEKHSVGEKVKTSDLTQDWHVYSLTWDQDRIIWYLDGKEVWRYSEAGSISSEDMYLLLNLAVGGEWAGSPSDGTKFPAEYLIDYVRIWQRDG
ncbi:family 16 glycosylhydrolase [Sinorhizobium fredii]|uniref:Family 16 glycosylhydrolase n=1 Tax=Rhizobium fredii TaxID=380 RepID=A0A844AGE4_RHIFR|nr:family 16 glycosylhydrolase [Sinorhizobium fredii]